MIWFEEKNASDAIASARLIDVKPNHFSPTRSGSAQFALIVVEVSSFTASKLRQLRLNLSKLAPLCSPNLN